MPAGPCEIGAPATGFSYDNERPRHRVDLPAFRIGRTPITNATFLHLRRGRRLRAPPVVERRGVGVEGGVRHHPPRGLGPRVRVGEWRRWTIDGWAPLDPDEPVVHVSWFEADALARVARGPASHRGGVGEGGDLGPGGGSGADYPWGDEPPDGGRANLDHGAARPGAGGRLPGGRFAVRRARDARRRVGVDVDRLPRATTGFVAHPYREYSEVFFGDRYKVLRGGSWATRSRVATPTFRNWDLPYRRQIFSGVRLAWDA